MKKVISMIAVLALVCFTTMCFAADAAAPATTPAAAAAAKATGALTAEAVKAASGEIIVGPIKKIDTAAKTIVVKGKTISVKAEDLATLKKGEKVKVTLAAGTMNAEKIVPIGKKAVKKEVKKAKEKAVEKATEKAVEQIGQ